MRVPPLSGRAPSHRPVGAALAVLPVVVVTLLSSTSQGTAAGESDPLLQRCASLALQRPQVVRPLHENRAGIWPNTGFPGQQIISGSIGYAELPEECSQRYARVSTGKLQMIRRGRWVSICGNCVGWVGNRGGTSRIVFAPAHPDNPASAPVYNTCDGAGIFHRVSIWVVNQLNRPATGSVEARSQKWRFPVAVSGNCAHASASQERVHRLWHERYGLQKAP